VCINRCVWSSGHRKTGEAEEVVEEVVEEEEEELEDEELEDEEEELVMKLISPAIHGQSLDILVFSPLLSLNFL